MPLHRRDFMKLLGISVASLYLNRGCIPLAPPGCYAPIAPPTVYPAVTITASKRERLRLYWLRFEELAQKSQQDSETTLRNELVTGHRAGLDELIADGEISTSLADLVQEAYDAAVYHVWRSNVNITCYEPMIVDYAPSSANVLVEQSRALNQLAAEGVIDPDTLAKAQAALEHDLSYYALTNTEVDTLYSQLLAENRETGQPFPSFEELPLELTPEAQEATQFIIDLLTGK